MVALSLPSSFSCRRKCILYTAHTQVCVFFRRFSFWLFWLFNSIYLCMYFVYFHSDLALNFHKLRTFHGTVMTKSFLMCFFFFAFCVVQKLNNNLYAHLWDQMGRINESLGCVLYMFMYVRVCARRIYICELDKYEIFDLDPKWMTDFLDLWAAILFFSLSLSLSLSLFVARLEIPFLRFSSCWYMAVRYVYVFFIAVGKIIATPGSSC